MATEAETPEPISIVKIEEAHELRCSQFDTAVDNSVVAQEIKNVIMNPVIEGKVGISEGGSFLESPSLAKIALEETSQSSEDCEDKEKVIQTQMETENPTQLLKNEINKSMEVVVDDIVKGDTVDAFGKQVSTDTSFENARTEDEELVKSSELLSEEKNIEECMVKEISSLPMMSSPVDLNLQEGKTTGEGDVMEEKKQINENISDDKQASIEEYPQESGILPHHTVENSEEHTLEEICESKSVEEDKAVTNSHEDEIEGKSFGEVIVERTEATLGHIQETLSPTQDLIKQSCKKEESKDKNLDTDEILVKEVNEISSQEQGLECKDEEESSDLVSMEKYPKTIRGNEERDNEKNHGDENSQDSLSISMARVSPTNENGEAVILENEESTNCKIDTPSVATIMEQKDENTKEDDDVQVPEQSSQKDETEVKKQERPMDVVPEEPVKNPEKSFEGETDNNDETLESGIEKDKNPKPVESGEKTESKDVEIPNKQADDFSITHLLVEEEIHEGNGAPPKDEEHNVETFEVAKGTDPVILEQEKTTDDAATSEMIQTSEMEYVKLDKTGELDIEEKLHNINATEKTEEDTTNKEETSDTYLHRNEIECDDTIVEKVKDDNQIYQINDADESKREVLMEEVSEGPEIADAGETLSVHEKAESTHDKLDTASVATVTETTSLHEAGPEGEKLVDASDIASQETIPPEVDASETSLQGHNGEDVKHEEPSNLDESANVEILKTEESDPDEAAELKYDITVLESEEREIETTTESAITASKIPLDETSEEKLQESSTLVPEEEELKSIDVNEETKDETPMEEEANDENPVAPLVVEIKEEISMQDEEPAKLEEASEKGSEDIGKEDLTKENLQNTEVIEASDEEFLEHSSQEVESEEKNIRLEDMVSEVHETAASSEDAEKSTCEEEEGSLKNLEESFKEELKGSKIEHIDDTRANETQRDEVVAFTDLASTEQKNEEVSDVKPEDNVHEENGACLEEDEHIVETFEGSKSTETAILEHEKTTYGTETPELIQTSATECMKVRETCESDSTEKLDIDAKENGEKETENKEETSNTNLDKNELECEDIEEGIIERDVSVKDHNAVTPRDETADQSSQEDEIEQKTIVEPAPESIQRSLVEDVTITDFSTISEEEKVAKKNSQEDEVCEALETTDADENTEKENIEKDGVVSELSTISVREETTKESSLEDEEEAKEHGGQVEESNLKSMEMNLEETDSTEDKQAVTLEDEEDQHNKPNASCVTESSEEETTQKASLRVDASDFASEDTIPAVIESSETSLQGLDGEHVKLEETSNLDENANEAAELKYDTPMGVPVTVLESKDREIVTTTESGITASETPLDEELEEKPQEYSKLVSKEEELKSVEMNEKEKDDTPMEEETNNDNPETPLVLETEEEPGKLVEDFEMGSEDIGKENPTKEVQKGENLQNIEVIDAKDEEVLVHCSQEGESEEKIVSPEDTVFEGHETAASSENVEKSTCEGEQGPLRDLGKSFKEEIKGREIEHIDDTRENETQRGEVAAFTDQASMEQNLKPVDLGEKIEGLAEESPNKDADDLSITHPLVEKIVQEVSEKHEEVSGVKTQEDIHEEHGAYPEEKEHNVETFEVSKSTETAILEQEKSTDGNAMECMKIEETGELGSTEQLDIDSDEKREKETENKELTSTIEEGIIEEDVTIKDQNAVTPGDETTVQSCREVEIEQKTIQEPELELIGEDQISEMKEADDSPMGGISNEKVCEGPNELGEDEEKQRKEEDFTVKDISKSFNEEETVKDSCEEDKKEEEKPEQKECEGLETLGVDECIEKQITQEDEAVKEHSIVPIREETIRESSHEDEKVEDKHEEEVSEGVDVTSASKNTEEKVIDESDIVKDHNTISSEVKAVKPSCQGDEPKVNEPKEEVCEEVETIDASEDTEKHIIEDDNAVQAHCTESVQAEFVPESPQEDAKDTKKPEGEVSEDIEEGIIEEVVAIKDRDFVTPGDETVGQSCQEVDIEKKTIPEPEPRLIGEEQIYETNGADDGTMKGILNKEVCEGPNKADPGEDEEKQRKEEEFTLKDLSESFRGEETVKDSCEEDMKEAEKPEQKESEGIETVSVDEYIDKQITQEEEAVKEHSTVPVGEETIGESSPEDEKVENKHEAEVSEGLEVVSASKDTEEKIINKNDIVKDQDTICSGEEAVKPTCQGDEQKANKLEEEVCETLETTSASEVTEKWIIEDENAIQAHCTIPIQEELVPESPQDDAKDAEEPEGEVFEELDTAGLGENSGKQIIEDTDPFTTSIEEEAVKTTSREEEEEEVHDRLEVTGKDDAGERQIIEEVAATELHTVSVGEIVKECSLDDKVCESGEGDGKQIIEDGIGTDISTVSVEEERTKESSHEDEKEAKKHEEEVKESNLISIEREIEAADSTEETETVTSKDEENPNKSPTKASGEEIIQKEDSEKVSETSTLVSDVSKEQIKEEILEKVENTNDMDETAPFEASGASLKGIDIEDVKLEETTNLDDNSGKEILAAENPNADEAEQEKEYEIPMRASVTVPGSVDREIKPTTKTTITDSKPQLDDKSEEKLHESSTLEPKKQELESIEADEKIKDETPSKDEIQDENLETPLVVETIEERGMLKEEPGKLEEATEMGSEDSGKESPIPELDTEEHPCESKDSDAILEREFIGESKTVISVPGLENDKLEGEKQIDVPSKELETTGACADTEKDILVQLEDPIKNLDQSFDESRKEHSEIKDDLVELEANDENRSLVQNVETVDQGEGIKSSSESVAQDTHPKTEKIETEEVEETFKGHDTLTVEDQMVGRGSQEEEKASKNFEEAKPKLEAEDQSDKKCADELSDNIILDEEVPQRVERADESENISVGDEIVKEVKDSDFVYTEKNFEATNFDENKEMEMLTEEDLNMKPNASPYTEESREEIIKKEECCEELAEVSKSVSEVSEDNIEEEILEETSSQEAKPEVQKIVEASGIVSKEDSSAIVETIETSIKSDEVESVNIGETSNLVSQLPIIENEKRDQEIVTVGKLDADNAETSCAREDTEKDNLEKDEPVEIPEENELLHDTTEKEENAKAVYASEHIETADVESPRKNTDDSPIKDSLIKEPLVHEVGGKCEEASYSEKLEKSLESFAELEGEENRSVKTNEANETTENDIVPEEVSVGLEKASASENIEKQISCEEDENTIKESHEEDEMKGEKVEEEAIKLEPEEQIHELETEEVQREITHEAKEDTKNEIFNEEVLENTGASENIEKQITWEEVSDKETYLVSVGKETAQGTAKEALELECEEHPDGKTNETIEKEIVNEEIKSSNQVLVESKLETACFSEKAEIVTIKDEEGPSTDFTAPPAAKEVSAIVVEELIPETVTENAEKMESVTKDTSAPEGLIEVEKLKNTSSELESSSTITEDLHIKEEVPTDTLEASSLTEDSQAEVQEKERKITEGEEKHEFVLVNQATAEVSPPTEESEGENIKNEAPVEKTLEMESKEKLNEANIQDKTCGNEDGETTIQDETPQNIEKLTKTSDATAEEQSSRETDSTESTETKFSTESIDIQSRSLESFSKLEGEENQSVKKNEANEPTENEIVPEEVYVGLEKVSASENTEHQISGEEEAVKDPYQISVGKNTVKEIHEEDEMKGEEVEEEATKLEPEEHIHEPEIEEVQRKITNEAQEDKKNEISIEEVLENTGASENIEKQITSEEGSVKEAYLVSVGEETVQEKAKEALELEPKELSLELECEERPDGKTNETIEKEIVNEEIKSSDQVLAKRELETTCFSEKAEIVTSKDEDGPSTDFNAPLATKEVSALVVEEPITETITKNAEKMESTTKDRSAPEVEKFKNTSSELESSSTIGITEDLDIKEKVPTDKLETSSLTEPSQAEVTEKEREIREDEEKHEFVFVNQATTEVSLPTEQRGDNIKNEALGEEILQIEVEEKRNEANIHDKICGNEDGETQIPKQEETPWNIENLKKTSDATTEEQTSSEMGSTENTETKFSTESIQSMTEVPTGVEDQKSGEASGIQSEVEGVDNEPKPSDSGKVSLCDLLERSTKETLKIVGASTEERNLDTNKEKLENKETPSIQVEEEKKDEEEKDEEGEEEEEDEHKKTDSGSDAPVMVEVSRDIEVKPAHKKSHNILSGVGSKVKHSIAKVKKAITGKSSHHKPHSPK